MVTGRAYRNSIQLSENWYFHNLQLCSILAHGTREPEKSQQEIQLSQLHALA